MILYNYKTKENKLLFNTLDNINSVLYEESNNSFALVQGIRYYKSLINNFSNKYIKSHISNKIVEVSNDEDDDSLNSENNEIKTRDLRSKITFYENEKLLDLIDSVI